MHRPPSSAIPLVLVPLHIREGVGEEEEVMGEGWGGRTPHSKAIDLVGCGCEELIPGKHV